VAILETSVQRAMGRAVEDIPDLIIIDDPEKDKEAQSQSTVGDLLQTIKEAIYPSMKRGYSTLIYIGTIIRKKCALGTILFSDDENEPYRNWNRKVYRAITKDVKGNDASLWPELWPLDKLLAIREKIGTRAFEKEYQNNPLDDEDALFKEEWIRYYHPSELDPQRMTAVLMVDPSARSQAHNDYKAIVSLALDHETMKEYVIQAWIQRQSINAMLYATYRMYQHLVKRGFRVRFAGFEANGFQSLLEPLYDALCKEMGFLLPLKLVTNKIPKQDRIERLTPKVERGKILFPKDASASLSAGGGDIQLLIEQLLYFPKADHDDGPDALAGADELLMVGNIKPDFVSGGTRESRKFLDGYDGPVRRNDKDFDQKKGRV